MAKLKNIFTGKLLNNVYTSPMFADQNSTILAHGYMLHCLEILGIEGKIKSYCDIMDKQYFFKINFDGDNALKFKMCLLEYKK